MRDDCGSLIQLARIAQYTIEHTPESILPYIPDAAFPDGFPDGCSVCQRATWWESRKLSNGVVQTRCTECQHVITWRMRGLRRG